MGFNLKFILVFLSFLIVSCTRKPQEIKVGKDTCAFCKMTISDVRFGAEAITKKGKVFKYDEIHCLIGDIENGSLLKENIYEIYLTDFSGKHQLINASAAFFINSVELKSPMGGNIAAFSSYDSLLTTMQKIKGTQVNWDQLFH